DVIARLGLALLAVVGWVLIPECRSLQHRNGAGSPRLMPSGPALRVEPRVRSRPRPEWHDHGPRRFVLTAPCAATGGGWSRMLVKPFGDAMRGAAARSVLDHAFEGAP